ncbi:MAG: DUF4358 domain-containing protein [Lachnospiraceae bacterium]
MKKLKLILVTLLSLLLLLAACGSKRVPVKQPPILPLSPNSWQRKPSPAITLSEVSTDIMASTYFVDTTKIEASSAYMSTGASACEAAVIKCSDADYASEVSDLLKQRVSNQKDLYSSHNAGETTKLENAIIKTSGNYVVLCVCDDTSKRKRF